ncbi:BLCAP apoptosis inducing factor bc10 [Dermatophagoides farinae]|uniref:Bladder cancer-associated protein n=1 Tax=Dermatophagoides farinae TaxID=6954 RepID=A0A922HY92_DERFA|nr:hypothetical protein DERF_007475 [Dermatophagoides farinae]
MYCLQWLIPVLLIPKPTNSFHLQNHIMFIILYMISCLLERKTCMICLLLFAIMAFILCSPTIETSLMQIFKNLDLPAT